MIKALNNKPSSMKGKLNDLRGQGRLFDKIGQKNCLDILYENVIYIW